MRASERRKAASRKRIRGRSQPGIDVVADRSGRIGEYPGQIEPIADAQSCSDLVGELRQQLISATAGDAVQFGSDVEQRKVGFTRDPPGEADARLG